jgi:hypothetical protein
MLGTTFKLGFDGSAVNRGLGGIGSMLGRFSRTVAGGAATKVGFGITDVIGRIVMAVPNAVRELSTWGSELSDLEVQTGISTRSLIELGEALRNAGAMPNDIGRTLSTFANAIYEVSQGRNQGAQEALRRLGITAQDLANIPLDEAFERVGKAIAETGDDAKGLESIMGALFGGMRGAKLLRFFKDYDANMEKMRRNTAAWGDVSGDVFGDLDDVTDALGRWEMVRRRIALGILTGIGGGSTEGFAETINKIFDGLSRIGPALEKAGASLRSFIGTAIEVIANDGFLDAMGSLFVNMGKKIAVGFAHALGDVINALPDFRKSAIRFLFGSGDKTTGKNMDDSTALLRDQLRALNQIEKKVGVAKFA